VGDITQCQDNIFEEYVFVVVPTIDSGNSTPAATRQEAG